MEDLNLPSIDWNNEIVDGGNESILCNFWDTLRKRTFLHHHVEKATTQCGNDIWQMLDLVITNSTDHVINIGSTIAALAWVGWLTKTPFL
jgi:hypothetical protein